jgi:hypothetical protein
LVFAWFFWAVSSIGCALVFGLGMAQLVELVLWVIFVDCIGIGMLISTFFWCGAARRGAAGQTPHWPPLPVL